MEFSEPLSMVLPESLGELIRVLGDAGVSSLISQPPTLEELFLRHYDTSGDTSGTASGGDGRHGRDAQKVSLS